jgi:diacylglycerol kinase family enzyme
MAGLGFDADLLAGASEALKKRLGWAAYVLSALRHLRDRPLRMVLRTETSRPQRRWANGVIAGNVGSLQGGLRLLPAAQPDDGMLDVAVYTSWGWVGWLRLAADVLQRRQSGRLIQLACRELTVHVSRARPWQVDGEVAGSARQLDVTLRPGSLLVRVPGPADT